ncbi:MULTISPECIES: alpha-xenorhabdolysin family binary toxin subunit A [unclassified Pseudomonas]|uniref:Alpha-xenorhabdolysin family binary toxin subunit A n=1 Tax=Pseudomonas sp. MYb327 TaxID=2745230 RepID=A0AAU8E117_9PSED
MVSGISNKVVEAATRAPQVFVNASLGQGEEYNRETGIQLTKEQIISLRRYESLGLSLPVRLQDVIAYLNYGAGDQGSAGLTAPDFLRTFSITYDHAKRWSPLREKIMLTGTDLKIFAGSIIRTGNGIVEVYEDLKASKYLEEYNIKTPEEYLSLKRQIPGLPDLELSADDGLDLRAYLNDLLSKVRLCHQKAEHVRKELDSFGTDMREKVLPEIKLRLAQVSKNTYQADIQALQGEIDERAKEIDELNKQYDHLVKEAIEAASSFNIGGLILGIYQGVKAEQIRKERNRLKQLQQTENQKMASKNQTLSSLNRVRDDLQNLSYVAIEAELATQNLMLVWNALSDYIAASVGEVNNMTEATTLRRFKNQILDVIAPWEKIKISADQLLGVFAEADKEYESNNLIFRSMTIMNARTGKVVQPVFGMEVLRAHNSAVQLTNTSVQMLFEQFDYQPGTVGVMTGLATAINRSTVDLRSQAQSVNIYLDRAEKKLKSYKEELSDPADADEVREDMEVVLKDVYGKLFTQTQDFKGTHKGLGVSYDRSGSQELVMILAKDREFAEKQKTKANMALAELGEEMKGVSEAIDLIATAGIEKIGEEVQLSVDSLKTLGLAPPQVQIALLAIDTLKKLISGIGEAISFLNMLAAYNRLKERVSELKVQVQQYTKDIASLDGKIELLEALDELDDGRSKYLVEFSRLIEDFSKFSLQMKQDSSVPVEERTDMAISGILSFNQYLKRIYQ